MKKAIMKFPDDLKNKMNKEISSSMTFILKFIIPIIDTCIIVIMSIIFILYSYDILFLLIAIIFALIFIYYFYISLKKISIDDNNLYISNYFKQIKISRQTIEKIKIFRFHSPNIITICLSCKSEFGNKIKFIPKIFQTLNTIDELEKYL
jgi:hypothetical protein